MGTEELQARVFTAQRPLLADAIHIWRTPFAGITSLADETKTLLSADERDRAERFRFPEHRDTFIAGRALLRFILGACCGCAARDLRFSYGEQGKPRINEAENQISRTVSFNLSHSRHALLIAVASDGAVGIDIEDLSRDFDVEGLMAECLTDDEARPLSHLSPLQRRNAFLRYWVHKEAFLKCVGTGFSVSPKEVHVAFDEAGCSEMRCAHPQANRVLFGRDLECAAGHVAAIATDRRQYDLRFIDL